MGILSPTKRTSGFSFQVLGTASSSPSRITTVNDNITSNTEDDSQGKSDLWKDRIEK